MTDAELNALHTLVDLDGDGKVSQDEFVAFVWGKQGDMPGDAARESHTEHVRRSKREMATRHWTRMLTEYPPPPDIPRGSLKEESHEVSSKWAREGTEARKSHLQQLQSKLQAASYKDGGQHPEHLFNFYDKDGSQEIERSEFVELIRWATFPRRAPTGPWRSASFASANVICFFVP